MSATVELRGIQKRYGAVQAVASIDLRIEPGQFVSLLGPSGCGKTTTLRIIAGLVRPDAGEVIIGGRVMTDVPVHHRGLGLVAQNYALFPHMTVMENVTFGLRMRRAPPAEVERKAHEALEMVRLSGFEQRYPRQLSGGQQQRVALARCLLVEPAVLLLDEPLGALDKKLREVMQVELKSLQRQVGITTIFVTHDQEEALTLSDRIAVMHQGRLQQVGAPPEVYEMPRTRFVAEFIGVCNFLEGKVVGREPGAVMVRTDGGALVAVATDERSAPAEGAKVVAAVRPEKLAVRAPGSPRSGQELSARLEALVYVGTAVHYHLRAATGERLIAYRQNNAAAPVTFGPGAEVVVSWDPGAARLLPEESS
ncbi:MAG: polyamine ABC transporter ATP-binding protein [Candidatus Rokuibacteriota bacterium]|nr:MAG: polyamine ABC transporter ATP-binding protein [Candidatus Rokubacteria bacterium]